MQQTYAHKYHGIVLRKACNAATKNSSPVKPTTAIKGKIAPIFKRPPAEPIIIINPANTFIMVCPANIFANSLIDKLIGLIKYEIISIGINNGAKPIGTPDGKKQVKNLNPCLIKAIKVTPTNIIAANVKVTAIWDVKV